MKQKLFCTSTSYVGVDVQLHTILILVLNGDYYWVSLTSLSHFYFLWGFNGLRAHLGILTKRNSLSLSGSYSSCTTQSQWFYWQLLWLTVKRRHYLDLFFVAPSLPLLAIYKKMLGIFVNPSFTSSVSGKRGTLSELLYLWMKHFRQKQSLGTHLKHCFSCQNMTKYSALYL